MAECYEVDVSTVYRLERQKKKTGSVKLRINQRGRKANVVEDKICFTYAESKNFRFAS